MCVIAYKPPGKDISKADLKLCFERNADGAGFMYPLGEKIIVVKGLMNFYDFWQEYKKHILAADGPGSGAGCAIHFRIGTSGKKDAVNCHPHVVADDFAFVHNGIMSEYVRNADGKREFSDTHHFMEETIRPLYEGFGNKLLSVGSNFTLIEDHIGTFNKMVFLSGGKKPYVWIMNKKQGTNIDGIWFSNTNWKPYVAPVNSYNGGGYHNSDRKDIAYPAGCWIGNVWSSWFHYRETYPLENGPFEKEYAINIQKMSDHGPFFRNKREEYYDETQKKWVKGSKKKPEAGSPPSCETGNCGETQTSTSDGKELGAETDSQGNVVTGKDLVPLDRKPDPMDWSTRVGCFIGGVKMNWTEYRLAYPLDNGPFEDDWKFWTGQDLPDPRPIEGDGHLFPEDRCVNCTRDLTPEELAADEHMCRECLISITNPS